MHIPPYHKKESWQRIFIGAFFGAIIAYVIIMYMYGSMYERLYEENLSFVSQINDLKKQNEALLQDKDDLNEKSKQTLTVKSIEVEIADRKKWDLDVLIVHQLEEMIKEEINHIIGEDISVIAESDELLFSTIENKQFSIDEFSYFFKVTRLTISPKVKVTVETKLSN